MKRKLNLTDEKKCGECGQVIYRIQFRSDKEFQKARFCSLKCYWDNMRQHPIGKPCQICGKTMTRKMRLSGLESMQSFNNRKVCGVKCRAVAVANAIRITFIPMKKCEHCGRLLTQRTSASGVVESPSRVVGRRFCNSKCFGAHKHSLPLKPTKAATTSRQRARTIVHVRAACEKCGDSDSVLDVHHKDANPLNNSPENLITLCRRCHKREHGGRSKCRLCDHVVQRRGLCAMHWERLRRLGKPDGGQHRKVS